MSPRKTRTLPVRALPVKTLKVEVTDGRDAPKSATANRIAVGTADDNDLVLSDGSVSRYHVELAAAELGVEVTDLGSTNGTLAGAARLQSAIVPPGTALQIGKTRITVSEGEPGTVEVLDTPEFGGIVGQTEAMRELMAQVQHVAASDASVLIHGESGTGKELIARAVHDMSPRADGPFEIVDCAGLPPALIASALFGHEANAFTGAGKRHVGAFERAHGGTVFLDEIGELPDGQQSALLGVAERKSFRRLGGTEEISVDVRLVSATHRDLRADVNAGQFRADLFYRVAAVTLRVPPLRTRRDDIPLLIEHFARQAGHEGAIGTLLPPEAVERLKQHHWPGNARELRNVVEATLALGEPPALEESEAPSSEPTLPEELLDRVYRQARRQVLDAFERAYLTHLLERADHSVSAAAKIAQVDRGHLTSLLQRHGLR